MKMKALISPFLTKRRMVTLLLKSGLLTLALATAATAAPALFTGNIQQRGGLIGYGGAFITTISAPASNWADITAAGGINMPADRFARQSTYTFTLVSAGYPFISVQVDDANMAGSLRPGYFTGPATVNGTNAVYPNPTATPRQMTFRAVPGAAGFGGKMPIDASKHYDFDLQTANGIFDNTAAVTGTWGGKDFGAGAIGGYSHGTNRTLTSMGVPLERSDWAFSVGGPWLTGSLTVKEPQGYYVSTFTGNGADARNAAGDTGTISLVTPKIQYIYNRFGGTVTNLREAWTSVFKTNISFVPEASQAAMLFSGVAGLMVFARSRKQNC